MVISVYQINNFSVKKKKFPTSIVVSLQITSQCQKIELEKIDRMRQFTSKRNLKKKKNIEENTQSFLFNLTLLQKKGKK